MSGSEASEDEHVENEDAFEVGGKERVCMFEKGKTKEGGSERIEKRDREREIKIDIDVEN